MATAKRRFVFKAKRDPFTPNKWNWTLWVYRGKWGRFEPWNYDPIDPNRDESIKTVSKELGSFPTSGTTGYYIERISVNGTTVYNGLQPLPEKSYTELDVDLDHGTASITFDSDKVQTTSESDVEMYIEGAKPWIPWLPYRDRREFQYDRRKGRLDPSAASAGLGASSIAIKQDIAMEVGAVQPFYCIGIPTLGTIIVESGLLLEHAANSVFDLSGVGRWTVLNDNTEYGSATLSLDGSGRELIVLEKTAPRPVLMYKFQTNFYRMTLDYVSPGYDFTTTALMMQGATVTQEFFSLKYEHYKTLLDLRRDCTYPFLVWTDAYPFRQGGSSNSCPRLDTNGNPILLDLGYRNPFYTEGQRDFPRWVDRLRHISCLKASSITEPEQEKVVPKPDGYNGQLRNEYLDLNSKIKINKLVKLNGVKLKKLCAIPKRDGTKYGYDDVLAGVYELTQTMSTEEEKRAEGIRSYFSEYYPKQFEWISGGMEAFDATKFFVIVEANANSDLDTIEEDKEYAIAGKLLNVSWLIANRGVLKRRTEAPESYIESILNTHSTIYNQESLMDEDELWKWLNISPDIITFMKTNPELGGYASDDITINGNIWVLVVRGRGEDTNIEEILTKDFCSDYVTSAFGQDANGTTEYKYTGIQDKSKITFARPLNIASLGGKIENVDTVKKPFTYRIMYEDSGGSLHELCRKVFLPTFNSFAYDYYTDVQYPLVPQSSFTNSEGQKCFDELSINYIQLGTLTGKIKIGDSEYDAPMVGFEIENKTSANSLPFTHPDYKFQIIRNGNPLPYMPADGNAFAPHPTEAGYVPVVKDGAFVGIRLNQPSIVEQNESFFLRTINVSGATAAESANPLKRAKGLKFEISDPSVSFKLMINRSDGDIYNMECVGLHRYSPSNEWYTELVPGRGLKVRDGHGMVFITEQSTTESGTTGSIQGQLQSPWVEIDPFYENDPQYSKKPEGAQANGITVLGQGTEIEIASNLTFAPNDGAGINNIYTLTTIADPIPRQDLRIHAIYDPSTNESILAYTSSQNRFIYKSAGFDWMEVPEYRKQYGRLEATENFNRFNYYNDREERTVYMGVPDESSTKIGKVTQLGTVELSAVGRDGDTQKTRIECGGIEVTIKKTEEIGIFLSGLRCLVQAEKQDGRGWHNTIAAKVSYKNLKEPNNYTYYGYSTSKNEIKPRLFYLAADRSIYNRLDFPLIEQPTMIRLEVAIPDGLTQQEFDIYKQTIFSFKISTENVALLTVIENQVCSGLAGMLYRNASKETALLFQGMKLFDDSGNALDPKSYGEVQVAQISYTDDASATWRFPRMQTKTVKQMQQELVDLEEKGLKKAGFVPSQIAALVNKMRQWDRPLTITTLSVPTVVYNKSFLSVYVFGFATNSDALRGDLVMWPINEMDLGPNYFTEVANSQEKQNGGLIRTEAEANGNTTVIAYNIPKQVVGVTQNSYGQLMVFYHDDQDRLVCKTSYTAGGTWIESKVKLFSDKSNFVGASNVFIVPNTTTNYLHFFALKPVVSDGSLTGEFQLYTQAFPMFFFSPDLKDYQIASVQDLVDSEPATLVVGNPNDVSSDLLDHKSQKVRIGNAQIKDGKFAQLQSFDALEQKATASVGSLDSNISTKHFVSGYFDAYNRLRIYYLNSLYKPACKVSNSDGQTWHDDLAV